MLINYKNIGDEMSDSDLNAYACFLANNKVLTDSFEIKDGKVTGVYGEYTFDLSNASIVDNGILITDETLSNNITVKLSNATQYATYTLHFTVVRYGDVNILDETTDNIETFDLSVNLIDGETVNIPLDSLQEYDVIQFQSNITITHNKPEIIGKYITDLQLTGDKSIIQTSETSILEITATDLEHLPIPNKSIQLLKNNTLLDTLTTDSQGKCSYTYTGVGAGKLDFKAKYLSLQTETYEIIDCTFIDYGTTGHDSNNYIIASALTETLTSEGVNVSKAPSGSTNGNYRTVTDFTGDFTATVEVKTNNQPIRVGIIDTDNSRAFANFNQTEFTQIRIIKTSTTLTIQQYTDDEWVDLTVSGLQNVDLTLDCKFLFYIYNTANDTNLTFKNLQIYPI